MTDHEKITALREALKAICRVPGMHGRPDLKILLMRKNAELALALTADASEPAPVTWLVKKHGADEYQFAGPNEKATNPAHWSDSFPVYANPAATAGEINDKDADREREIVEAINRLYGGVEAIARHIGRDCINKVNAAMHPAEQAKS